MVEASSTTTNCGDVATALGLALLDTIAVSATVMLKSSGDTDAAALVGSFRWAFFASAGVAVGGVLVAVFVINNHTNSRSQSEQHSETEGAWHHNLVISSPAHRKEIRLAHETARHTHMHPLALVQTRRQRRESVMSL
jgi:hypothetical protein